MDDARLKFYSKPIVTGTPAFRPEKTSQPSAAPESGSFRDVLKQQLDQQSGVAFSKHAASRVAERSIDLSAAQMDRLNKGVKLAEEKGLDDTLILIDRSAFLVNVKNNTVITAVGENDLNGNVFTNIDGTVII